MPPTSTAPAPTSTSQVPVPVTSPRNNTGAIVGGAVGGTLGLLAIGLAAWICLRRRKNESGPGTIAGHADQPVFEGHIKQEPTTTGAPGSKIATPIPTSPVSTLPRYSSPVLPNQTPSPHAHSGVFQPQEFPGTHPPPPQGLAIQSQYPVTYPQYGVGQFPHNVSHHERTPTELDGSNTRPH